MEADHAETCFVIMPFGNPYDSYYEGIYRPAIIEAGLMSTRADEIFRPGHIIADIWNFTNRAKLILADLSTKNPNVFYELGLAHAILKPAILLTDSIEDVPFDLRNYRVIIYNKQSYDWGIELKEKIRKAILETLQEPERAIPSFFSDESGFSGVKLKESVLEIKDGVDNLKREFQSVNAEVNFDALERRIEALEKQKIASKIPRIDPGQALSSGSPLCRFIVSLKELGMEEKEIKETVKEQFPYLSAATITVAYKRV